VRINIDLHPGPAGDPLNDVPDFRNAHAVRCSFSHEQGRIVVLSGFQILFEPDPALGVKVDLPLLVPLAPDDN
jgi:hypothetical protein